MYLTRHASPAGPRWAVDGRQLPRFVTLGALLELPGDVMRSLLTSLPVGEAAEGPLLAPLDADHEVWAAGVTYLRSREAREAESSVGDVYAKVYGAERPELFLKATGTRVVAHEGAVAIRSDSSWDVPEPEIVLVINQDGEVVGYCAGNDMSSRSIEGENPLYLPQAKIYDELVCAWARHRACRSRRNARAAGQARDSPRRRNSVRRRKRSRADEAQF